jgi:signal transduction histidine kinase
MVRSLRSRLVALLLLLIIAAAAAGALMFGLFRQSAAAQVGQAQSDIARSCEAIASAYRFFTTNWEGPSSLSPDGDKKLSQDLTVVVSSALRKRPGVEGGIRRNGSQSLAYAFPTYQGSGPKTDEPAAELPRIEGANRAALTEDRVVVSRFDASSQILLVAACPLPGPIAGLSAWAMTRIFTLAGDSYRLLMAGLAVLFCTVFAAAAVLARLTISWSNHTGRIEAALQGHDIEELPTLSATGERELDRIVHALNEAGQRLAIARNRSDNLARQLATGERLAAIGRLAAGVAHEIRNPIGAMRLKAENAIIGDAARKDQALSAIIGQIDRLDQLVQRLLSITAPDKAHTVRVELATYIQGFAAAHGDLAGAKGVTVRAQTNAQAWVFDPEKIRSAIDNLLINAIQAAPQNSVVTLAASSDGSRLMISVHDEGDGPPAAIREHLFEPFVTGRPEGVGLGLTIVREVAAAHDGIVQLAATPIGTTFEIILPCPQS